ncbi:UDP-N-acetylmuramate dehydrogenase [uncultured Dubosiella sp.]|uniref:UDP-N-acetylmuramate dehydrogenase n=1 Tax=uncultured Dubosiella sp. TaxID=1937011 RepID=UPI00272F4694|nr:UDP-N-acetylmuramate dehydrogenase [uncultured Dubosiella sp.]
MILKIEHNVLLKSYTTLGIGGPADTIVHPETIEEIRDLIRENSIEQLYILGNGSNVLFGDEGYAGKIVHISAPLNAIEWLENGLVAVESGATNQELAAFCQKHGLQGYEFASGIPGTVGGAIVMNAGAYNGETKDVLDGVEYVDAAGELVYRHRDELDLSYRHSFFSDHFGVIVKAYYRFENGDPEEIQARIDDLTERRYAKQPMDQHSAGSTFKRPEGHFASALIDQSGLRGYEYNGAAVSDKHTGFLINKDNASAEDFLELIARVQKKVYDDHGVWLECEVKQVPSGRK